MTQQTEIPTPPGGGSWTFDEASWQWKSNDPIPEQAPVVVADEPVRTTFEQE